MKKYFPISEKATDLDGLILCFVVYLLGMTLVPFLVSTFFGWLGFIAGLLIIISKIYSLIGLVIAVLVYFKKVR